MHELRRRQRRRDLPAITIAIAGTIAAVVGYKYFDAEGALVGTSSSSWLLVFRIGLVVACLGALWFAAVRLMKR